MNEPVRADRFLELSLLFTIVVHAAAMVSMALLLLPGMPGSNVSDAGRAAYVAAHPWLWRLGWFPWQLTALSDLILAIALVRCKWIPRPQALLVLLATLVAVGFEQPSEFRWVTTGITLAQSAVQQGNLRAYLDFEAHVMPLISAWAATFYTVAAFFWSWCFVKAGIWNRFLTWLSVVVWSVLLAVSVGPLLPENLRLGPEIVAAGNAVGFVLLMIWLCTITELVLRRSRPDSLHARMAPWRHPATRIHGRLLSGLANSRLARAFGELLPPVAYASDITDVLYINYLVDAKRLEPLVPRGLELQRLGPGGEYAFFTCLTYRHGHFGPRFLGPLRRLLPSPIQSNWRIHVRHPKTGILGIHFVTTCISGALQALLARLLSEGIPMHLPHRSDITAHPDGSYNVRLDPGSGSAPDLNATLTPDKETSPLVPPWSLCFGSYREMLAYCVPQDRAMSSQPWYCRITRQEIQLGIPLEACEPFTGAVKSLSVRNLIGDNAQPICFRVPRLYFQVEKEIRDPE